MSRFDWLMATLIPIRHLPMLSKAFLNWHELAFFRLGIKHKIKLKLRNGKSVRVKSPKEYTKIMETVPYIWSACLDGLGFSANNNLACIRKFGRRICTAYDNDADLANASKAFMEIFLNDAYGDLDIAGKVVLDVGANIGDSALYFAAKGAKRIFAYEPYPRACRLASTNARINGFQNIKVVNAGMSGHSRSVMLEPKRVSSRADAVVPSPKGKRVGIITLEQAVATHGITNGVLKLDCEGEEYGIILGCSRKTLRAFSQIAVEYHKGYADIARKLSAAGFRVKHTMPEKMWNPSSDRADLYVGMIFADRIGKAR